MCTGLPYISGTQPILLSATDTPHSRHWSLITNKVSSSRELVIWSLFRCQRWISLHRYDITWLPLDTNVCSSVQFAPPSTLPPPPPPRNNGSINWIRLRSAGFLFDTCAGSQREPVFNHFKRHLVFRDGFDFRSCISGHSYCIHWSQSHSANKLTLSRSWGVIFSGSVMFVFKELAIKLLYCLSLIEACAIPKPGFYTQT